MTSIDWRWSPNRDFGNHYLGGASILDSFSKFENAEMRILEGSGSADTPWRFLLSVGTSIEGYCEAFSPYGYSAFGHTGPMSNTELNELRSFLQSENVIDLFIRHNPWQYSQTIFPDELNHRAGSVFGLGLGGFTGDRETDLAAVPQKRRSTVRRSIKEGVEIVITPAQSVTIPQRDDFVRIYRETMHASGARKFYFFNSDFFEGLFRDSDASLYLVEALSASNGKVLASALFVGGPGGTAHYFLSGALPEGKVLNATDFIIFRAAQFFAALGFGQLNLGGATPLIGSGLATFKKSWSSLEEPYFVSKIVCDTERYLRHRATSAGGHTDTFLLRDLAATGR